MSEETNEFWKVASSKSKRICALCEVDLKSRNAEMKSIATAGRLWCSYIDYRHPKFKSKRVRLCGACAAQIRPASPGDSKGDGDE